MKGTRPRILGRGLLLVVAVGAAGLFFALADSSRSGGTLPAVAAPGPPAEVTAIGRLEPRGGLIRIAGPSDLVVVVGELAVEEGDPVEVGQTIAVLDDRDVREAEVERARAELANATSELERKLALYDGNVIAESIRDEWQLRANVARANLHRSEARARLAVVRSPINGRVIEVHASDGERVGEDGIVEIARVDDMYAIAEVYETDVSRVAPGQRARVSSPALPEPVFGTVEFVGMKVGKADNLGTDPAAKTDARVVEVEVRLDDSQPVAGLTNLQVEVEIGIRSDQ